MEENKPDEQEYLALLEPSEDVCEMSELSETRPT